MNEVIIWLEQNYGALLSWLSTMGLIGGLGIYILKKAIPALKIQLIKFLSVLVAQMFGISTDNAEQIVTEAPFIKMIETMRNETNQEHIEYVETKLVDYAIKLSSGVLSENETILIRDMFDKLLTEYADKISLAILNQIKKLVG